MSDVLVTKQWAKRKYEDQGHDNTKRSEFNFFWQIFLVLCLFL